METIYKDAQAAVSDIGLTVYIAGLWVEGIYYLSDVPSGA